MKRLARTSPRAASAWTSRSPFCAACGARAKIDWQGRFDRIDRANILPRPRRQIPIFCGGVSDAALKRAARLADGFIFAQHERALATEWPRLRQLLREEGRAVDGFGAHSFIMNPVQGGLPEQQAADAIRRWQDAGGTHASIVTMGKGFLQPGQHIDFLSEVQARL